MNLKINFLNHIFHPSIIKQTINFYFKKTGSLNFLFPSENIQVLCDIEIIFQKTFISKNQNNKPQLPSENS